MRMRVSGWFLGTMCVVACVGILVGMLTAGCGEQPAPVPTELELSIKVIGSKTYLIYHPAAVALKHQKEGLYLSSCTVPTIDGWRMCDFGWSHHYGAFLYEKYDVETTPNPTPQEGK
jgi:hypothetical protein